jgi:hypothetical protein
MTHHRYISIIGLAGLLAWIAWGIVVSSLSPFGAIALSLSFFFITLSIALTCTFTVVGFYFRLWLFRNEIFYKHINIAFRQGLFLSILMVMTLVLQMLNVLSWWSGILLISFTVLLEFYFSSKDSQLL